MGKLARKEVDEKHLTTLKRLKVERKSSGNGANTRENRENSTPNIVVVEDDHQTEEVFCDSTLGLMF